MTISGHIQNGVVVFDEPITLPEGTVVQIQIRSKDEALTHFERFKEIIGKATDLPKDFAEHHDHYIHGTPEK